MDLIYYLKLDYAGVTTFAPVRVEEHEDETVRLSDAIAYHKSKNFSIPANVAVANNARPVAAGTAPAPTGGDACPRHGAGKLKHNSKGPYCSAYATSDPKEAGWNEQPGRNGTPIWFCSWRGA